MEAFLKFTKNELIEFSTNKITRAKSTIGKHRLFNNIQKIPFLNEANLPSKNCSKLGLFKNAKNISCV